MRISRLMVLIIDKLPGTMCSYVPDREVRAGRGWTALGGCEAAERGFWPLDSSHPPRGTADDAAAKRKKEVQIKIIIIFHIARASAKVYGLLIAMTVVIVNLLVSP